MIKRHKDLLDLFQAWPTYSRKFTCVLNKRRTQNFISHLKLLAQFRIIKRKESLFGDVIFDQQNAARNFNYPLERT